MSAWSDFTVQSGGGAVEKIRAASLAGIYTSIHVSSLELLFDVGVAIRSAATAKQICITHGHLDHTGALPSLLGIRSLVHHGAPAEVYLPEELCPDMEQAIDAFAKVSGFSLPVHLNPCKPGDVIPMRKNMEIRCFATDHRGASLGYAVWRKTDKLKPEYAQLSPDELRRRKLVGTALTAPVWKPYLAYTGDSLPSVFEHEPYLYETPVLIHECTFLDQRKSLERAHQGCHTHLDEFLDYAPLFKNQTLMLTHFSQLYKPADVRSILEQRWTGEVKPIPIIPDEEDWWN